MSSHPAPNLTARFLGPPESWFALRLELRDVHGLWGGVALTLFGTGLGWAVHTDPAGGERRIELNVPREQVAALLQAAIAADLLALTFSDRPGIPDEGRPELTFTNLLGQSRTLAKWANDPAPAFDSLHRALLALARPASR